MQHLTHIGHGQGWQHLNFELLDQLGVARMGLSPVELCFSNEPQCQGIQSGVMDPGAVLPSDQFVPPGFRLCILENAFCEVALRAPQGQLRQRCLGRGIAYNANEPCFLGLAGSEALDWDLTERALY